jgi:hypothetical protein
MSNRNLKFGIGISLILAVVAWEAISGFQQSKTYYVTVGELTNGKAARRRVRVGGVVVPGSIERRAGSLTFWLSQEAVSLPAIYVGADTLHGIFVDGFFAIVQIPTRAALGRPNGQESEGGERWAVEHGESVGCKRKAVLTTAFTGKL